MRLAKSPAAQYRGQCSITVRLDTMQVIEDIVNYAQAKRIGGHVLPFALYSRKQVAETAVCYFASLVAAHIAPDADLAARLLLHRDLWAQQGVPHEDLVKLVHDTSLQAANAEADRSSQGITLLSTDAIKLMTPEQIEELAARLRSIK